MDVDHPEANQGWDHDARSETPTERLDRNWSNLLQELRVVQTGVQLLTGFLLTLPFQQRFDILDFVGLGRVLSLSIVIAVIDVILITAIATLAAFLYNVSSALVGGLQLTLTDD